MVTAMTYIYDYQSDVGNQAPVSFLNPGTVNTSLSQTPSNPYMNTMYDSSTNGYYLPVGPGAVDQFGMSALVVWGVRATCNTTQVVGFQSSATSNIFNYTVIYLPFICKFILYV